MSHKLLQQLFKYNFYYKQFRTETRYKKIHEQCVCSNVRVCSNVVIVMKMCNKKKSQTISKVNNKWNGKQVDKD